MELLFALTLGLLTTCGVYLLLRARTFPVVVGLTLIGRAAEHADPLPQALVLTAIVIGFAMTAFALVLALRGQGELDNDHVDGKGDRE